MSTKRGSGTSPLDRLKTHYDKVDLTCSQCGFEDREGNWRVETTGSEVHYQHLCPSCGANRRRTIRL